MYLFVLLFFFAYYTWQSTHENYHYLFDENDTGSYADLAEAFLHGQVSLVWPPDPRMDLIDPYNPYARGDVGAPWDYSFYRGKHEAHGKLYLYFGPVPALLFYCPWKLITGHWPSQQLIFLIISLIDLGLYACLLRILVRTYFPQTPPFLEGVLLLMYGLCNLASYLQCTVRMYQVAIGSGVLFTLGFFLCALLALRLDSRRHLWLGLASLCTGLAFGSRANDVLLYGVLAILWFYIYRQKYFRRSPFQFSFGLEMLALFLPALLCALGLAWYNEARFENPFEFGWRYQINDFDLRTRTLVSLHFVPEGIWAYFLMPWRPVPQFPFINPNSDIIPDSLRAYRVGHEVTTGIITSFPIVLLGLAWPFYIHRMQNLASRSVLATFGIVVTAWSLGLDIFMVTWNSLVFSYMMELIMPMLILASLTLLLRRQLGPFARWQIVVLTLLLVYSCYVGVAYGLIGEGYWIFRQGRD